MSSSTEPKKYGLVLSKQKTSLKPTINKPAVFADNDSDDDNDSARSSKKVSTEQRRVKSHIQNRIAEALQQDPSVFEYDAVFDDIQQQRSEKDTAKQEKDRNREPKYVKQLLRAAAKRQNEYEAREERKQTKEREKEGDQFGDKEVFVTSTYRQKMEELERYKQEERRREYLESVMDVTKQKDISGFYKHYLNDLTSREVDLKVKQEPEDDDSSKNQVTVTPDDSSKRETKAKRDESSPHRKPVKKHYRARNVDDDESSPSSSDNESSQPHRDAPPVKEEQPESAKDAPAASLGSKEGSCRQSSMIREEQPKSELTEQQEKALLVQRRMTTLRRILAKKTTEQDLEAYRQRYFERKAAMIY